MTAKTEEPDHRPSPPDQPWETPPSVLVVGVGTALWLDGENRAESLSLRQASARVVGGADLLSGPGLPLVCHRKAVARRLGIDAFEAMDGLELFAFVRPARFCVPTVRGLAEALALPLPHTLEAEAATLRAAALALLRELAAQSRPESILPLARTMERAGWSWGQSVRLVLATATAAATAAAAGVRSVRPDKPGRKGGTGRVAGGDEKKTPDRGGGEGAATGRATAGLEVWKRLGEWSDHAPPSPPGNRPVDPRDTRRRLAELLGEGAEHRPAQQDYASAVSQAFGARERSDAPNIVLAEAGTGVGKTLGYIAPASLWAEQNDGLVWLSTYTRNLQHQIDTELDRLYPNRRDKERNIVVRKGRENYLCLLNYDEAVGNVFSRPTNAVPLGLLARWLTATRDGDIVGGDFPSWLGDLMGRTRTLELADRRGECVFSACPHYNRCFIEKSIRRAKRAQLVVANHALVIIQAVLNGEAGDGKAQDDIEGKNKGESPVANGDGRDTEDRSEGKSGETAVDFGAEEGLPTRYVFDEGHQVFDAADSAFSAHLTVTELADMRRWVLGAESRRAGRSRGLMKRLEELIVDAPELVELVQAAARGARALPGEGVVARLESQQPDGPAERFFLAVRHQVYARAQRPNSPYGLETDVHPLVEGLLQEAGALDVALDSLRRPLLALRKALAERLVAEADSLDTPVRLRIEGTCRSLTRRAEIMIGAWRAMLRTLNTETPAEFVDWFGVDRLRGRDTDLGMHRHWVDPGLPFARHVLAPAQGAIITSATLRDATGVVDIDWEAAETRTGARHLMVRPMRAALLSPYDYGRLTRVFVVDDVSKDQPSLVASAYHALFQAAGGGALGLFTAVARLRDVYGRIAVSLEQAGLPMLAQHVDPLDTATLIDIFRADESACLLGTDAVRDGIDVPGRSLRLIVFDRVPWPRPDILHRARRKAYGQRRYDDMLTRFRLRQAFGRLVRRADDHGVFVLLDSAFPTRLAGAFPENVPVRRVGLAEAVSETRQFLQPTEPEKA